MLRFFILCVVVSCAGELIQGFICNQPDPITGEYPLRDNSNLPLNIFGQAWLVNDILLGAVVTLYIWGALSRAREAREPRARALGMARDYHYRRCFYRAVHCEVLWNCIRRSQGQRDARLP